jgi:prepilin-type N-terminal cleavage/methylation domain-containing protein
MTKTRARNGYTLLEVIVVMAVMVIIAGLAIPSMSGRFPSQKIVAAVDSVRAAWARARAHAIEEGRPYRFAVMQDTGRFRVAPDQEEFWGGGSSSSDSVALILEESLPKGVRFNSAGDSAAAGSADSGNSSSASAPSAGSYSNPIVFLPDGTARENAEILFEVRGARSMKLTLRALTGVASIQTAAREGGFK